ncbi:extracellular matrix regulator RemB [Aeribacillus pallidus]|uniref:extracellular matrix regulator RemB n=1 Tax=Aeribacillus pallidus TaxID=33936 RepID=UPI003D1C9AC6
MYVHVGGDVMVQMKEIIAILDYSVMDDSIEMETWLTANEKKVIRLSKRITKSIVITDHKIYLSPLASTTLKKRSETSIQ